MAPRGARVRGPTSLACARERRAGRARSPLALQRLKAPIVVDHLRGLAFTPHLDLLAVLLLAQQFFQRLLVVPRISSTQNSWSCSSRFVKPFRTLSLVTFSDGERWGTCPAGMAVPNCVNSGADASFSLPCRANGSSGCTKARRRGRQHACSGSKTWPLGLFYWLARRCSVIQP